MSKILASFRKFIHHLLDDESFWDAGCSGCLFVDDWIASRILAESVAIRIGLSHREIPALWIAAASAEKTEQAFGKHSWNFHPVFLDRPCLQVSSRDQCLLSSEESELSHSQVWPFYGSWLSWSHLPLGLWPSSLLVQLDFWCVQDIRSFGYKVWG